MSTHTPGPWVHTSAVGWDAVSEKSNRHSLICRLSLNNPANARLIAAAPDLLGACKHALEVLIEEQENGMNFESILDHLNEAIAKAEGAK